MAFSSSPVIEKALKSDILVTRTFTSNEIKISNATKSVLCLLKEWDHELSLGKVALASISKLKDSIGWKLETVPDGPKLNALLETCDNFNAVVDNMDAVANNLKTLAQQMVLLANLEQYQLQGSKKPSTPVFPSGTWDSSKFGVTFQKIADIFEEELKVLRFIKEEVAESVDKSTLTSYVARWNVPLCTSHTIILLITGILIETGMCNI